MITILTNPNTDKNEFDYFCLSFHHRYYVDTGPQYYQNE